MRKAAIAAAPIVVLALAIAWLPGWLRPSLSRARVRTAVVTAGPIEASITASGLVAPSIERVISSPLDARVLRVLRRPGAALEPGEPVVELDISESLLALQRAENDLLVTDNRQQQTRLQYETALVDLDARIEVRTLELEARRTSLSSHKALAEQGLLSQTELRQSELAVRQAEVELAQLKDERANAARSTGLQLEGLALERATLERDLAERRRVLDLAMARSDRTGVLTWVIDQEGVLIRRGDVLARVADLSAFRVDATISDIHADRLRPGLPVVVRVDDAPLAGRIAEVYPTVENGSVRFTVALDDPADSRLRPNLRTDVQVITDRKSGVLKVARGAFADGAGTVQLFVVRDGRGVRTSVALGVSSFDEVEVLAGLTAGDEIITSDMRDYLHLEQLWIR
jgi:HlyD family secretion protein